MKWWEAIIELVKVCVAFGISGFTVIKLYQEFLKNQLEKARMKAIDVESVKLLLKAKEKIQQDIDTLVKDRSIDREDIKELQRDFNETIKMFLEYQLKK